MNAQEWKLRHVVKTFKREYEGELVHLTVGGDLIKATSGHPFWVVEGEALVARPRGEHIPDLAPNTRTAGRWVDAGDLRTGDVLPLKDGRYVPITRKIVSPVRTMVFNFHVEELQCYAVGASQILVHNNSMARLSGKSIGTFSRASEFGIKPYAQLAKETAGKGLRAHHLIEKRFAGLLGLDPEKMASIALTPAEHQVFTNAWRAEIPYGAGTANATREQVLNAARRIYRDYPEILRALGL